MSKILNFERILCPVAESHETDEGLLYAIALARSYRAKLFVLTCSDDSSRIDSDTVDAMQASIKRAVEHSYVLFPSEVVGGSLDYEFIVTERSRPADSIKHEAQKQDADLIVMSSRPRPYAARYWDRQQKPSAGRLRARSSSLALGKVAICVARYAISTSKSCWLPLTSQVTQNWRFVMDSHSPRSISRNYTCYTLWLTQRPARTSWPGPRKTPKVHITWRQDNFIDQFRCDVTHVVREGKAYREIVSYAVEQEIDLICIGAHGQGFKLGSLFGSNTDRVLREAPCPF